MLYRDKRTRRLPPIVKQMLSTPFSSRQLAVFGQRRQFSDPLKEESYALDSFRQGSTETMPHLIEPVDVLRGSRESTESLVNPAEEGPPTTNSNTGGGGGGSGLTGTGTDGKLAKWTGGTSLGNSIVTELSNKIGVGTSAPTDLLHVDGTTRTTGLKIPTGAVVGRVWTNTNATTGEGAWQAASGATWGSITGTLSAQTDLQAALDAKASKAFAVAMGAAL